MKFRDREDGNIYPDIRLAVRAYCRKRHCTRNCELFRFSNHGCSYWAGHNPTEAARLMGYEVIDDSSTEIDETPTDTPTTLDDTPTKEDDMDKQDKPRLAEVLGVEVGEKWRVVCPEENIDSFEVWLNEKGHLIGATLIAWSTILCAAINHPECIIRTPHLTEPEIDIMRAVGAKYVSRDLKDRDDRVSFWDQEPVCGPSGVYTWASEVEGSYIGEIRARLFPSVKPGDCIELEE